VSHRKIDPQNEFVQEKHKNHEKFQILIDWKLNPKPLIMWVSYFIDFVGVFRAFAERLMFFRTNDGIFQGGFATRFRVSVGSIRNQLISNGSVRSN